MRCRAEHFGILQLEGCKRPLALLAAFYALFSRVYRMTETSDEGNQRVQRNQKQNYGIGFDKKKCV